jgi:hypothetical protein
MQGADSRDGVESAHQVAVFRQSCAAGPWRFRDTMPAEKTA